MSSRLKLLAAAAGALAVTGCVTPYAGANGLYASPIGNAPVTANPTPYSTALAVEVMQAVGDELGEAWITQGAGAVRGGEVLVELVGELAVVAGFGDVVPRRRIRGEEDLAGAKPVIEEFTRQRIGEAEEG